MSAISPGFNMSVTDMEYDTGDRIVICESNRTVFILSDERIGWCLYHEYCYKVWCNWPDVIGLGSQENKLK